MTFNYQSISRDRIANPELIVECFNTLLIDLLTKLTINKHNPVKATNSWVKKIFNRSQRQEPPLISEQLKYQLEQLILKNITAITSESIRPIFHQLTASSHDTKIYTQQPEIIATGDVDPNFNKNEHMGEFTVLELMNRIFQDLSQYPKIDSCKFSVEELRNMLDLEELTFAKISNIINPGIIDQKIYLTKQALRQVVRQFVFTDEQPKELMFDLIDAMNCLYYKKLEFISWELHSKLQQQVQTSIQQEANSRNTITLEELMIYKDLIKQHDLWLAQYNLQQTIDTEFGFRDSILNQEIIASQNIYNTMKAILIRTAKLIQEQQNLINTEIQHRELLNNLLTTELALYQQAEHNYRSLIQKTSIQSSEQTTREQIIQNETKMRDLQRSIVKLLCIEEPNARREILQLQLEGSIKDYSDHLISLEQTSRATIVKTAQANQTTLFTQIQNILNQYKQITSLIAREECERAVICNVASTATDQLNEQLIKILKLIQEQQNLINTEIQHRELLNNLLTTELALYQQAEHNYRSLITQKTSIQSSEQTTREQIIQNETEIRDLQRSIVKLLCIEEPDTRREIMQLQFEGSMRDYSDHLISLEQTSRATIVKTAQANQTTLFTQSQNILNQYKQITRLIAREKFARTIILNEVSNETPKLNEQYKKLINLRSFK